MDSNKVLNLILLTAGSNLLGISTHSWGIGIASFFIGAALVNPN